MSDVTTTTQAQYIALDLLAPKLGLTSVKKAVETVRKLARHGIIGPDDFTHQTVPKIETGDFEVQAHQKIGRGRPALTYFLSPLGALALAMHVRTPEAAAWRQAQVGGIVKRQVDVGLAGVVEELRARVAALEEQARGPAALNALEQRRALPAKPEALELVEVFAEVQNRLGRIRGLTAAEALQLAPELSRFGSTPRELGYALRSAARTSPRLRRTYNAMKLAVWDVERRTSAR